MSLPSPQLAVCFCLSVMVERVLVCVPHVCGVCVGDAELSTRLKLHNAVGPLLVQNVAATLLAADGLPKLQRCFLLAIGTDVEHRLVLWCRGITHLKKKNCFKIKEQNEKAVSHSQMSKRKNTQQFKDDADVDVLSWKSGKCESV